MLFAKGCVFFPPKWMGAKRCNAVNVNPDWGLYSVDHERNVCIKHKKDNDRWAWSYDWCASSWSVCVFTLACEWECENYACIKDWKGKTVAAWLLCSQWDSRGITVSLSCSLHTNTHTYMHTHWHTQSAWKCSGWMYIKALQGQNVPLCICVYVLFKMNNVLCLL